MTQELRLIGVIGSDISFIQDNAIALCKTYREAVRLSWDCRKNKGMTKIDLTRTLCNYVVDGSVYASHISDYLNIDDNPKRRDLKAEHLAAWARVVGNYGVQQWLAYQDRLTFVEEIQARRYA